MCKYDLEESVRPGDTSSHGAIVRLVGGDRRVLDVGCATGYLARGLVAQGCTVVGVDNDAAAAERARDALERLEVVDLETVDLVETFGPASFDAVVFGDVLEHLRDPHRALRQARRLLRPGGVVVTSIPNVAHGDLRLALLDGRFDYVPTGLLDETHVHLYTHDTIRAMLRDCGLAVVETIRVQKQMFDTEVGLDITAYPVELVARVLDSPDSQTYQFVMRSVPADEDGALMLLSAREHELAARVERLAADLAAVTADLAATGDRLALAEAERDLRTADAERAAGEVAALRSTITFRSTERARGVYGRLRALR